MHFVLFDGNAHTQFLPFTYTRPVAEIRIGIHTLREKWEIALGEATTTHTVAYLQTKWPETSENEKCYINPTFFPEEALLQAIRELKPKQKLVYNNTLVACVGNLDHAADFTSIDWDSSNVLFIEHTWDIFAKNAQAIAFDFERLTRGRRSAAIPPQVVAINPEQIFIEEGAKLPLCVLNATNGPIYIGKNAEIMEATAVRGPLALCHNATLKMGAKIYGATTIGPHCKVGGEVNNSVFFGFSNKAHDGFLGNSVIGTWCNLGADTNTSNLKNNYAEVRLWNYNTQGFAKTGLQFCGLMMGDHSKCGINTMFNTGTVVGVSANVFGSGFPRNFIPSFSWGGSAGFTTFQTRKAFEVAEKVMGRRDQEFDAVEQQILQTVFEATAQYRNY